MAEKKDSSLLKWVLIGCGGVLLIGGLAVGGCAWFVKSKVDQVKAEMEKTPEGQATLKAIKEGTTKGEGGFAGAMTGLAGAGIGLSSGALAIQVMPSLTPEEQVEAKEVFKAFAEKSARMKTEDFDAYSEAVKRFTEATEPARKAKQEAMNKETDPAVISRKAADLMKVEPAHAKRLVADLKAIADRL